MATSRGRRPSTPRATGRGPRGALTVAAAAAAMAIAVAAFTIGASAPAAALTPIEPDNAPRPIPGVSNGQLPASMLLQISPSCVAYGAAASSMAAMIGAAAQSGVTIAPAECYRDLAGQQYWRAYYCGLGRCQMAAVPGTSNHGWGKAADLRDQNGSLTFGSPGYTWLKLNAWRFGWNHPGWAEPGSSAAEPWHWEWVGDGGTKYPGLAYATPMGGGIVIGGNPIGSLDSATSTVPGAIDIRGWALDPDVTGSVAVHVYLDGALAATTTAAGSRPDLAAAFPAYGAYHGFGLAIGAASGSHQVCAYAINTGLGNVNPIVGCRSVTVGGSPVGSLDGAAVTSTLAGATVAVNGWALDPDDRSPISVDVSVDGAAHRVVAAESRGDVGAAFPTFGAAHGFSWTGAVAHGSHQVCAWAIDVGPGSNTNVGCRTVTVDRNPFGSLDGVAVTTDGQAVVRGWTIDPDTAAPATVHVYVDGVRAAAVGASAVRGDVGAVFPAYGSAHGYDVPVRPGHGVHTICAYGINAGAGDANVLLGCRAVTVNLNPLGRVDAAQADRAGTLTVTGWTLDPESPWGIDTHVYIDGAFAGAVHAVGSRPDIAAAFPGYGDRHGFSYSQKLTHGSHTVCVYAINVGTGDANPLLGCRTVVVDLTPFGSLEPPDTPNGTTVHGWVIDPDAVAPTTVLVQVDGGATTMLAASLSRPDVAAVFPGFGTIHGFSTKLTLNAGLHRVCAVAINAGGGAANPSLGCVNVAIA